MAALDYKPPSRLSSAAADVITALLQYRVWLCLGWIEIKQRYRRSVIGPWWISLNMLIFITAMSIVFSRLFHQGLQDYVPFFTAGYLFWLFISSCISEATDIFRTNSHFIKQIKLPFTLYVLKHLVRNSISLLHNVVVYILVCLFFQFSPGPAALLAIPGFFLVAINMYWICLVTGLICSRFRDMIPIVGSCVQIAFFITPISWMPRLLEQNPAVLKYNPFVYLLDVVRSPLLGEIPRLNSYLACCYMALIGIACSTLLFSSKRSQIVHWVD